MESMTDCGSVQSVAELTVRQMPIASAKQKFLECLRVTKVTNECINPLNPELNPMYCLLALLGAHHLLHVSSIRVKSLTFRRLMSYIYIYIWSTHS